MARRNRAGQLVLGAQPTTHFADMVNVETGEVEASFPGRSVDDDSMWNQVWMWFGKSHLFPTLDEQVYPRREFSDYKIEIRRLP